jgi:phosphatidylglycerophosphatase C
VKLAVFDLDGTITRHDTLLPYVMGFHRSTPWRLLGALRVVPVLILFVLGLADRGRIKAALIKGTLGGCSGDALDAWTARFVPKLLASGLMADAVDRIAAHKRDGDWLVLMSASTDLYVPDIAHALEFNDVICTGVKWTDDRLDGDLSTPNRRGAEKARCFEALIRKHPGVATAAYGNAGSDLDHLRLADDPHLVNPSIRARREAIRVGVPCTAWK